MLSLIFLCLNIYISKPNIIFFSGGSNLMPKYIYNDFLNKLTKNYNIYKLNANLNYDYQIQKIYKKNNNILFLAHSSGCVTAINNNKKYIKKMILLDPVKTLSYNKNINLNNLNKLLIINAELSYKWSNKFPFIPFIPAFSINKDELNIDNNKCKVITIKNYGHSDLLIYPWRDIMHYSRISNGNNNRSNFSIQNYYNILLNFFIE